MLSEKLNKIVNSQIEKSTEFWAGKPKLTKKELSAVASFAKKKGEPIDKFFSSKGNKKKFEDLYEKAINQNK